MTIERYSWQHPGHGNHRSRTVETRQSTINFPGEMHDEIRERAVREHTSFSEQVRLLVEWGLESGGEGNER